MLAGSLEIQLAADVARLRDDMAKATGIVSSGANAMARAASVATAALGALGVGLSAAAMINFAKQINDGVDALNDMADATGSTVEKMSALDRIERTFGHATGTATSALLKFNQSLSATDKAGSDAEKVLTALGLSVADLKGMDPADALMATAQAMSMFADDGNKARAAQELFGKSLKDVAPLLKDLVEAGELNATVTTKQAQEAEKFNRELFKMEAALTDAGRAIANPMVTGMNGLIEQFRLGAKEGDGFIVTLLKQTEIARLLGMNGKGNGYSDVRKELELLDASLKKGNLTLNERTMAMERQAELNKRMAGYLGSSAGAGRGVSGYGDLPRGSLLLPPELDKKALDAAKKAAAELQRLREEEEKFRIAWGRADSTRQGESVMKRNEEEAKAQAKAIDGLTESRNRQFDADAKVIKSAEDMVAQAQFELSIMGLSNVEREKAIALRQLEATGIDKASLKYAELAEAMNKVIGDRAAMQKQIDDFQNVWNSIDRTAQQTFTNIFEGGQDAFTKLRDTLKATLLDLLYQMTVRKWVFNVAASVTGQSSGVAGAVGQSSGIGSIGGMGGLIGGGSSLGIFGQAAGATMQNGLIGGFSANMANIGTLAEGGSFLGAAGAAMPYIGAALAVASLLESDRGGPKTEGGADLASTIQQQYNGIAAQLGITNKAIFEAFYSKDPQGDSLTQLRVATLSGGRNIYERLGEENVGRSDAEFAAAVGDATMRAIIAALKDSDLSNEYKQYLNALADDASTADMQRAIDLIGQRKALDEEWLTLTSTDAENLARARKRELDAMDPTLRAIKERIWAEQDLRRESEATAAMQTRLGDALLDQVRTAESAARDAIARQDAAAVSLRRYLAALTTGPMAALSPEAQYQATRSEFMRLSSLSLDDPERQSKLEEVGTAFLEASRSYNASSMAYFTDLAMVRGAVEASQVAAQTQADIGRMQLTALQSQYGMLSAINGSVIAGNLTVSAAIASLAGALSAAGVNGVRPTTPTGGGAADYYADNPAAAAPDPEGIAFWNAVEQSGAYRDMGYDSAQQWFDAHVAYLNSINGSHANGLAYVPFDGYRAELHQGERVLTAAQARTADAGYMEMVTELRGLRSEVARLTAVSANGMQANLGKQDMIVQNTGAAAKSAQLEATRGVMA